MYFKYTKHRQMNYLADFEYLQDKVHFKYYQL